MKAVLWADTIQMCVMFAGLFTLLICGVIAIGGFSVLWETASQGQRLDLFVR
jgi:Na+/proline symporter